MKRTELSYLIILCLLSTMILMGLALNIQLAKADSETIYIRSDGSVDPSDAPIQRDGDIYTFTDNIYDSLAIQRSNVTIDGAGHILDGENTRYNGIWITGAGYYPASNVTIKNTRISNFAYGVHLDQTSYNVLDENDITNNADGIYLFYSSYNIIQDNNISDNTGNGVLFAWSNSNTIAGNLISESELDGILVSSSNDSVISENHIVSNDNGVTLSQSSSCSVIGNNITANNNDGIYLDNSLNNIFNENNVTNNEFDGLRLEYSLNNTISWNNMTSNQEGIRLYRSSNNLLQGNTIKNNSNGIVFWMSCSNNRVHQSNIANSTFNVWIQESSENVIAGNKIVDSEWGIGLDYSSNNKVYHNYFAGNNRTVGAASEYGVNIWDDGYPSGGNYWSDYNGPDSNSDAIGDTTYEISENNIDNYPLVGMFSDFNATPEHNVQTICNSTISNFQFNGTSIIFNVSGEVGTTGFCRICIPTALINGTYRVFVNGTEILPSPLPLPCSNSTHGYLYFTYELSTKEVIIVPEFPSFLVLPLFILSTLLAVSLQKKAHHVANISIFFYSSFFNGLFKLSQLFWSVPLNNREVIDLAKYQCVGDFTCELCNKKGLLQIIPKSYARVRHYSHLDPASKKPQFIYHRQNIEYVGKSLSTLRQNHNGLEADHYTHDLKKPNSYLKPGTCLQVEPPPGFEPGIFSLQGRPVDQSQIVDWNSFRTWIFQKYSHSYGNLIWSYSKRFYPLLNGNLRDIDIVPATVRNNAVKSLIVLAKFLGIHNDFKNKLKSYGIKLSRPDAFASFMRIYNNHSSDLAKWYSEAMNALRDNEKLWLRFLSQTGTRKEEAIISFNKVIELARDSRLADYYNDELSVLEHFKFKELFLRGTKNVYVSIVPKCLIAEVASTQPVSYSAIRKRLKSNNLSCRMNELRDYFGTYMIKHGLIKEEVDLLQGRIPPSIFLRHYWSPSFKELRDRTLEATKQLEKSL